MTVFVMWELKLNVVIPVWYYLYSFHSSFVHCAEFLKNLWMDFCEIHVRGLPCLENDGLVFGCPLKLAFLHALYIFAFMHCRCRTHYYGRP